MESPNDMFHDVFMYQSGLGRARGAKNGTTQGARAVSCDWGQGLNPTPQTPNARGTKNGTTQGARAVSCEGRQGQLVYKRWRILPVFHNTPESQSELNAAASARRPLFSALGWVPRIESPNQIDLINH